MAREETREDMAGLPPDPGTRFVMLDGEFGGPDFVKHSVLAWSLAVFRKAASVEEAIIDTLTVHFIPVPGTDLDPKTKANFFDTQPGLLEDLAVGAVTPVEGVATINAFLNKHFPGETPIRFVSKPKSVDVGRFTHMMCTYGPEEDRRLPHYTSVCLMSQCYMAQNFLHVTHTQMNVILREERMKQGVPAIPTHHPLDDCKSQISDFLLIDRIMRESRCGHITNAGHGGHHHHHHYYPFQTGVMFTPVTGGSFASRPRG